MCVAAIVIAERILECFNWEFSIKEHNPGFLCSLNPVTRSFDVLGGFTQSQSRLDFRAQPSLILQTLSLQPEILPWERESVCEFERGGVWCFLTVFHYPSQCSTQWDG